jgi:cytidyltransferase-like protein
MATIDALTEVPTRPEIRLGTEHKIFRSLDRLSEKVKDIKEQGKRVGYVTGTFDVLHLGHVGILDFAKNHCDVLVVGVANDALTKATKGSNAPFFDQETRCKMLSSLGMVDLIFPMDNPNTTDMSDTAKNYLNMVAGRIEPSVIIASPQTDSNFKTKKIESQKLGCKLIEYNTPPFSSSNLIRNWVENTF